MGRSLSLSLSFLLSPFSVLLLLNCTSLSLGYYENMPECTTHIRWWWYLPVALLIGVACHQIWLTRSAALNPWSGGGFGMFSTMDAWGNRPLQAFAVRPGIRREVEVPPVLEEMTRRVRAFPSEANLRALATALVDAPTPDVGPLEAIELQVWSTNYDPVTLAPTSSLLRSLSIAVDAP